MASQLAAGFRHDRCRANCVPGCDYFYANAFDSVTNGPDTDAGADSVTHAGSDAGDAALPFPHKQRPNGA